MMDQNVGHQASRRPITLGASRRDGTVRSRMYPAASASRAPESGVGPVFRYS